jgi:hypothetical protein
LSGYFNGVLSKLLDDLAVYTIHDFWAAGEAAGTAREATGEVEARATAAVNV